MAVSDGMSPQGGPLATQRITMKAETRRHLVALNRRFYQRHSQAFDGSRQRPWRGWQRLVELLEAPSTRSADGEPLRVLDAGCGNGRLASFLRDALPRPLHYVGVDSSPELLAQAAQRPAAQTLVEADLLSDELEQKVGERRFDLVTSFGVLHHVPGLATRLELLQTLAGFCRPGGLLVVSVWRLDRQPRFADKVIPWTEYLGAEETAGPPLDLNDLEPGDVLLGWSGDRSHPRYCHFPDDAELVVWQQHFDRQHLDRPTVHRWPADGADGATNLYLAWPC